MPVQGVPLTLMDNKDWKLQRERARRAARRPGLEPRRCSSTPSRRRRKPFGRLHRLGPGAQKEAWRVEHVSPWNGGTLDHRRQPGVPGHGRRPLRGLRRARRRASCGRRRPAPASSRRRPPTRSTASSTCRSRSAGAASTASRARARDRKGPGTVYTFALGGTAKLPEFVEYQHGRAAAGRAVRQGARAGGHDAVRQQLRLLPRRAGRATAAATSRTSATRRPR